MGWTPVLATIKLPLGMDFSSSGVISGRSIICRLWDGSFFPLEMEPLISLWLKRVKAQAMDTLLGGGEVPGFKVVEGKLGNRKWTDELKVAEALKAAGYGADEYTETKLLSPAAMDKSLGKKKVAELLETLIDRAPGAPTIVPASDKRPPLDRAAEAMKDFE